MPYFPQYQQPAYPALQAPVYNTYQQPPQQQTQPEQGVLARLVTSREEALAAPVDFMGRPTLSLDMAHGMIYLKVFNSSTGSADFTDFGKVAAPESAKQPVYAPMTAVDELKAEVEKLKQKVNGGTET